MVALAAILQSAQCAWIDAEGEYPQGSVIPLDCAQGIAFVRVLDFDEETRRYWVEYVDYSFEELIEKKCLDKTQ